MQSFPFPPISGNGKCANCGRQHWAHTRDQGLLCGRQWDEYISGHKADDTLAHHARQTSIVQRMEKVQ